MLSQSRTVKNHCSTRRHTTDEDEAQDFEMLTKRFDPIKLSYSRSASFHPSSLGKQPKTKKSLATSRFIENIAIGSGKYECIVPFRNQYNFQDEQYFKGNNSASKGLSGDTSIAKQTCKNSHAYI